MNKVFLNLVWKEWQAVSWKVWFMVVLMSAFMLVGYKTRVMSDDTVVAMGIMLPTLFFPGFVAMTLAAGEKEDRTYGFQFRLPVSMQMLYLSKYAVGMAAVLVPLIIGFGIVYVVFVGRELTVINTLGPGVVVLFFAVVMYNWIFAIGVRCKHEATVFFYHLILFMVITILHSVIVRFFSEDSIFGMLYKSVTPYWIGVFGTTLELWQYVVIILGQIVVNALVIYWGYRRFLKQL